MIGSLVLLVIILWAGSWFLAKMGPSSLDAAKADHSVSVDNKQAPSLMERVVKLEALFAALINQDEAESDQIRIFENAFGGLQRQLMLGHSQDVLVRERLIEVEQAYHDWQGSRLSRLLTVAEQQLAVALENEAYAQALEALDQAYAAQQTINTQYPKSWAKNTQAAVALARRRAHLAAMPLHTLVQQHAADAEVAISVADWVSATQSFEASIQAQMELNEKHRDAPQVSVERLRALQQALENVASQQVERSFKDAISAAESSFQGGAFSEAADHYARAREIEVSLVADRRIRFAPEIQRLAAFAQKLQTELSQETWHAIVDGMRQVDERIRSSDYEGLAVSMEALAPLFQRMESEFAASQFADSRVQEKFRYIRSRLSVMANIQQRIQAGLLPVPKVDGIKLLRTELRQSTYRLVMGEGVAEGIVDEQPAHSVTLAEAQLFCRRLGWLLAMPVHLPTESIYRATLEGVLDLNLQPFVWCGKDRVKAAQAVAQKQVFPSGFYDILGNVGEWLAPANNQAQPYRSFGGDFKSRLPTLKSFPAYTFQSDIRSRALGFRVVVSLATNENI
jgi:hypothetical protein